MIDVCCIGKYLIEKYPNSKISYIGEGWSAICFQVDDYIYKFSKQYFEDFVYEKIICDSIRDEVAFELPQIELNFHQSYSMYNKLEGELGNEYLVSHPDEVEELPRDCARFLHQIHSCKVSNGVRNVPTLSGNTEDLSLFLRKIINNEKYEALIIDNYQRILADFAKETVLIHGDFYGSNFTVNDSGHLKGIFDWCNGGLGEREFDFVALYIHHGRNFTEKVIREYSFLSSACLNKKRIMDLVWFRLINRTIYAMYDTYDLWTQFQQFCSDNQEEYGGMLYYGPVFI